MSPKVSNAVSVGEPPYVIVAPGQKFDGIRVPSYEQSRLIPKPDSSICSLTYKEFTAGVQISNSERFSAGDLPHCFMSPLWFYYIATHFRDADPEAKLRALATAVVSKDSATIRRFSLQDQDNATRSSDSPVPQNEPVNDGNSAIDASSDSDDEEDSSSESDSESDSEDGSDEAAEDLNHPEPHLGSLANPITISDDIKKEKVKEEQALRPPERQKTIPWMDIWGSDIESIRDLIESEKAGFLFAKAHARDPSVISLASQPVRDVQRIKLEKWIDETVSVRTKRTRSSDDIYNDSDRSPSPKVLSKNRPTLSSPRRAELDLEPSSKRRKSTHGSSSDQERHNTLPSMLGNQNNLGQHRTMNPVQEAQREEMSHLKADPRRPVIIGHPNLRRAFVLTCPRELDHKAIREIFKHYAPIHSVAVEYRSDSKRQTAIRFILTFPSPLHRDAAINQSGSILYDENARRISCRPLKKKCAIPWNAAEGVYLDLHPDFDPKVVLDWERSRSGLSRMARTYLIAELSSRTSPWKTFKSFWDPDGMREYEPKRIYIEVPHKQDPIAQSIRAKQVNKWRSDQQLRSIMKREPLKDSNNVDKRPYGMKNTPKKKYNMQKQDRKANRTICNIPARPARHQQQVGGGNQELNIQTTIEPTPSRRRTPTGPEAQQLPFSTSQTSIPTGPRAIGRYEQPYANVHPERARLLEQQQQHPRAAPKWPAGSQ